jgi:hypothetical protein
MQTCHKAQRQPTSACRTPATCCPEVSGSPLLKMNYQWSRPEKFLILTAGQQAVVVSCYGDAHLD